MFKPENHRDGNYVNEAPLPLCFSIFSMCLTSKQNAAFYN